MNTRPSTVGSSQGGPGDGISFEAFSTHSLPQAEQFDAWRSWSNLFEVASRQPSRRFPATSAMWRLEGCAIGRVTAQAIGIRRTKALICRHPVDHWVITLTTKGTAKLAVGDAAISPPAGIPFIVSLADEITNERSNYDQVQLFLSRDHFSPTSSVLDTLRGVVLDGPSGRLIGDYMFMLERNLPAMASVDGAQLRDAIGAMVQACLTPTAEALARAAPQLNLIRLEQVRRIVRKRLQSPSLGATEICRELAISRAQLYGLLQASGGVATYIRRQRLLRSYAMLCDTSNSSSISSIAEALCFRDASTFARAFRREFGVRATDVRAGSCSGAPPAAVSKSPAASEAYNLAVCLSRL